MIDSCLDPVTADDLFQHEEHQKFTFKVPTPKCKTPRYDDLCPTTILLSGTINGIDSSNKLLRILFDSGSRQTMIHQRVLPKGTTPQKLNEPAQMSTVQKWCISKVKKMYWQMPTHACHVLTTLHAWKEKILLNQCPARMIRLLLTLFIRSLTIQSY